jgi:hypothetical protein
VQPAKRTRSFTRFEFKWLRSAHQGWTCDKPGSVKIGRSPLDSRAAAAIAGSGVRMGKADIAIPSDLRMAACGAKRTFDRGITLQLTANVPSPVGKTTTSKYN